VENFEVVTNWTSYRSRYQHSDEWKTTFLTPSFRFLTSLIIQCYTVNNNLEIMRITKAGIPLARGIS